MGFFDLMKGRPSNMPPLQFHNTLSNATEIFTPLSFLQIKMYTCGPTAYDRQHIGNLFPAVVADVLHRTLVRWGYTVKQVTNITDFGHLSEDEASEDKMTKGLKREGLEPSLANMRALAEKYTALFLEDLPLLGINPKYILFPRASDYILDQVALVKTLEQKGYAYRTSDGIYFDVAKFTNYGKLGNIDLAGLKEGARVEGNAEKHGPHDFALWKFDGKLGWPSPWGQGFPGWHIECTAMIFKLLGKQIDIHMGGVDLIPTHHNNEIAQAEAATGKQFSRHWIHNAHITIEGKKISKSLGNTVYLHNLTDRGLHPRALRYWFLTGTYRTPMNFTWEAIEGANTALMRLQRFFFEELANVPRAPAQEAFLTEFHARIANDLDTPRALALLWELVRDPNIPPAVKRASLFEADKILGLGFSETHAKTTLRVTAQSDLPEDVAGFVAEREKAREAKDFARADALRAQIEEKGFDVKYTPSGPQITKR
ncbi:cysteine--tRNA ligase [Acetobacteraceae bacterium]|nr:cysteine--tRNA ligase [Candidatus Parcubacteria bacterium]